MVMDPAVKNKLVFPTDSIRFPSGEIIKQVSEVKIVGFQLQSDLRCDNYVKARRNSGLGALWSLRKLANKNIPTDALLKFYKSYVYLNDHLFSPKSRVR